MGARFRGDAPPIYLAATACGVFVTGIGVLVLIGWAFELPALKSLASTLPSMKANMAIALIAIGSSILLLRTGASLLRRSFGRSLGALAAAFGGIVVTQSLFGGIGVDQALFDDPGSASPGRPTVHAALVVACLGAGLVAIDIEKHGTRLSGFLFIAAGTLALAAIVGYAYDVGYLRGQAGTSGMALHTALALSVATVGACVLRPERGLVGFLRGDDPGAAMARVLAPAAVIIPIVLGAARLVAERHLGLDSEVGVSLVVLCTIGLLLGVIAFAAVRVRRAVAERDSAQALTTKVVEGLSVGVAACDREGRLTFMNRELKRIHGIDDEVDTYDRWPDLLNISKPGGISPLPSAERPLLRALGGERVRRDDLNISPEGLVPRSVQVSAEPLEDQDGEVVGAVATITDETGRREAEQIRKQLAAIVEWSNDAIVSQSLDGMILSWNTGAEDLYGYSMEEAIGSHESIIVPADRRDEQRDVMKRVAGAERVDRQETVRLRKDGALVDVSLTVSPMFDADSRIIGASVIAHDISARRQAERMFGQLIEMAPDAVVGIDQAGSIEVVNSKAEEMFGYHREELLWKDMEALVPGALGSGAPERAMLSDAGLDFQGMARPDFERSARRCDGSEFPCEISLATVETDGGLLTMAVVRDVSERKLIEEEADRLKSEFFGLVSHELRTPLTSIVGYADILSEEEGSRFSPEGRHYLEVIKRNTHRLDRLVQDLLLVGQVDAGTFQIQLGVVDVSATAGECAEEFRPVAEQAGVSLTTDLGAVREFMGDQGRLAQVIENLVSNAVKFTPAGGEVVLRVAESNESCVIEVSDSGEGIGDGELGHLFDRFYRGARANTEHIKGVGLGLAITKAIVEAHHGEIEIQSEVGTGSTFRVVLPMRPVESSKLESVRSAS